MLQDIDFENMSYEKGLALVAQQKPLIKQSEIDLSSILSSPYLHYGLAGAGIGGLGGLASSLFKKKRRRNYTRDALTGALIGGVGGVVTRGAQDAITGLGETSETKQHAVDEAKRDWGYGPLDPIFGFSPSATWNRFKRNTGLSALPFLGATDSSGYKFPSDSEVAEGGSGWNRLALHPASTVGMQGIAGGGGQVLRKSMENARTNKAVWQKLIGDKKFAEQMKAIWGKNWHQKLIDNKIVNPGGLLANPRLSKILPSAPVQDVNMLKKVMASRELYQKALGKVLKASGKHATSNPSALTRGLRFGGKSLWSLLPMVATYGAQTGLGGYTGTVNRQRQEQLLNQ